MSILKITSILFVSAFAWIGFYSEAQSIHMHCQATQIAPGDSGKRGNVTVQADKSGDIWNLSVKWDDESQFLISPLFICGTAIAASQTCVSEQSGTGPVFSLREACGIGGFDTRGLPHHSFDAGVVFDHFDHGNVFCAAHDKGVYADVELSNCRAD